jgi:hypothetical protein
MAMPRGGMGSVRMKEGPGRTVALLNNVCPDE